MHSLDTRRLKEGEGEKNSPLPPTPLKSLGTRLAKNPCTGNEVVIEFNCAAPSSSSSNDKLHIGTIAEVIIIMHKQG